MRIGSRDLFAIEWELLMQRTSESVMKEWELLIVMRGRKVTIHKKASPDLQATTAGRK